MRFSFKVIKLHKNILQVRIEGKVEKLPMSTATQYFQSRPYESQLGALCSAQSQVIESREELTNKLKMLRERYQEGQVPKPEFWGGYRVVPTAIEFWQGQTDRVHDRIKFRRPVEDEKPDNVKTFIGENGWVYERLQP